MQKELNAYITDLCNALQISCIIPSRDISRRYNSYAAAPVPLLARAANHSATWLRRYKLYPVINTAKKLGVKRLVLGVERPETRPDPIPPDDRHWLEDRLFGQVQALEKILGPLPQWHSSIPD